MKKLLNKNSGLYILSCAIMLFFISCERKNQETEHHHEQNVSRQEHIYTCPMHPQIIRNEPGTCPICGMDLVEKVTSVSTGQLMIGALVEPVNETVILQAKTIMPQRKSISSSVEAKGYITYNPKNTISVSSRFDGRIDKLYVKYNFQEIVKGQKIMDVYSPELLTAQQNYVFLLKNEYDDLSLLNSAKQNLLLLGMNKKQVQHLEKTKKAESLITIYAPASGHIHQMATLEALTMPVMTSVGSEAMNNSPKEFTTREGMYVKKGEAVFNIISLSDVWVILKIYPDDAGKVKVGQSVDIVTEIAPDNPLQARVSFIEPVLEKDSKFMSVRVYLEESDHHVFKIGSLVSATINTGEQYGLWIPGSAVLDLGNGNSVVFLKEGRFFRTHQVTTGAKVIHEINILNGLSPKDTVAIDASYMIDSEGFILTK